jgi:hypothetical protein
MEKNCSNPPCFQGKNYKAKFLTSLIFKKKINKENFGNNHKKKRKKNHTGKYVAIYNVS